MTMKETIKDYSNIIGWGIDADPKNDPTYPLRHRTEEGNQRYDWERPTLQPTNIEVVHSIERPNISAVFGTAMPPKGLSGMIRRLAFKYSESSYAHWLPLIIADRVNVIEGILEDFTRGHIPKIWAEKGMRAEWRYNRKALSVKMLAGVVVTAAAVALLCRKYNRR